MGAEVEPRDDRAPAPWGRVWLLVLAVSLVLWQLPYGGGLLYPFKLLSAWSHELSHAVVMTLTGAGFDRLELYPDGSGLAFAHATVTGVGGAAIAASGYMGASAAGAVILTLATTPRRARLVLGGLALVLAVSAAVAIGNRFGQIGALSLAAPATAIAAFAPGRAAVAAAQLVAAQGCVHALLDVRVLFRSELVVDGGAVGASDAHAMAQVTFGTDARWAVAVWASVWLAWTLGVLYLALRRLAPRRDA